MIPQVERRQEHRGARPDPCVAAPQQGHRGPDVRPRRGQLGRQGGRRRPQRPLQERPLQGARPGTGFN